VCGDGMHILGKSTDLTSMIFNKLKEKGDETNS